MDPLAAAASIVNLLQIAGTVINYLRGLKDASEDIKHLIVELSILQGILMTFKNSVIENATLHESLYGKDGLFDQINSSLNSLASKIGASTSNKITKVGNVLRWPLKKDDVKELFSAIERHKTLLILALENDLICLSHETESEIFKLNRGVTELQDAHQDAKDRRIIRWLSSPDPSANHNAAREKHSPMTGSWFIDSDAFQSWWHVPSACLWVYGLSGCGKSILASTIIDHASVLCKDYPDYKLVYFYFDFQQESKRTLEGFLRSMLVQLSQKTSIFPEEIQKLYSQYESKKQQPTVSSLTEAYLLLLKRLQPVYIVVDALDECSTKSGTERQAMLGLIRRIKSEDLDHVNILILSRQERDIEEELHHVFTNTVTIQSAAVDADIKIHVQRVLANDSRLLKWPPAIKAEIETSLVRGAHGMFRWVDCQIDVLRKCLRASVLRQALQSLPEGLDGTYDRILLNIPLEYHKEAYTALRFLAVATCPLSIADVAEAVAVDHERCTFDPEDRLPDPFDILEVLSSLVTYSSSQIALTSGAPLHGRYPGAERATELRLAHYSVKEYLLSDRIRKKTASRFSVSVDEAQNHVAEICLIYLLWFDQRDSVSAGLLLDFPFGLYAAEYWYHHAYTALKSSEVTQMSKKGLTNLCVQLLSPQKSASFINWLRLSDPCQVRQGANFERTLEHMATPLYYACYMGLLDVVRALLSAGADINGGIPRNRSEGRTPLQGAIEGRHQAVLIFLLESGVDANAHSGSGRTPLHQAALLGNETAVDLLVQHGADLDASTGPPITKEVVSPPAENPLRLIHDGRIPVTGRDRRENIAIAVTQFLFKKQMFLESRLFTVKSVNEWSGWGHGTVLSQLLVSGDQAEVDSATGWTALHEASWGGHVGVVRRLVRADVESKTRYGWRAMHFAAWNGHTAIVRELTNRGASLDARTVYGWTPLHSAAVRGHEQVVRLLLDGGAEIEAQTSFGWTAVFGALANANLKTLALLLDRGANTDACNSFGGTALHRAARAGMEGTVKLLLQHGANRDIKSIYGTVAIQEAALKGHISIAQMLYSTPHPKKDLDSEASSLHSSGILRVVSQPNIKREIYPDAVRRRNSRGTEGLSLSLGIASTSAQAVSVMFVCRSNLFRSPMAEAVFRSLTNNHARIGRIMSAGIGYSHKGPPDQNTVTASRDGLRQTLRDNGISEFDPVIRAFQTSDLTDFDYILAMDEEILQLLLGLPKGDTDTTKIMLFGDFGGGKGEEVLSPYYNAKELFEIGYQQVTRFSKGFIAQVLDNDDGDGPIEGHIR